MSIKSCFVFGVMAGLVSQRSAVESSSCVAGRHQKMTWDQRGYRHAVGRGWLLLSRAAGIVESTGEWVGEERDVMGGM